MKRAIRRLVPPYWWLLAAVVDVTCLSVILMLTSRSAGAYVAVASPRPDDAGAATSHAQPGLGSSWQWVPEWQSRGCGRRGHDYSVGSPSSTATPRRFFTLSAFHLRPGWSRMSACIAGSPVRNSGTMSPAPLSRSRN